MNLRASPRYTSLMWVGPKRVGPDRIATSNITCNEYSNTH